LILFPLIVVPKIWGGNRRGRAG